MKSNRQILSETRINRMKVQDYCNYSDAELSELAFGNRFAIILCSTIIAIGVTTAIIPILIAMTIVAFFRIILPYHPFDYIYNHLLRNKLT